MRPDLLPSTTEVAADLLHLTPEERTVELAWPLVLVVLAVLLALDGCWWGATATVVAFFPRFGVAFHDLLHGTVGLGRRANQAWLGLVGLLALQSGHAAQAAHQAHHRFLLSTSDPEAGIGRLPWWRGLLAGPLHHPRIVRWALAQPSCRRAPVVVESVLAVSIVLTAVVVLPWTPGPLVVVALVLAGDGVFPVLSQTFLHPRRRPTPLGPTRTVRGRLFECYFLELGYHVEHHAYPAVPTRHVAELARRIEPTLRVAGVHPTHLW